MSADVDDRTGLIRIEIDPATCFTDSYNVQLMGRMSFRTGAPQQWLKREARRLGMTEEELVRDYHMVWRYDSLHIHAVVGLEKKTAARTGKPDDEDR